MRKFATHLILLAFAVSCQTPAPPREEPLDDKVIPRTEPLSSTGTDGVDVGVKADPASDPASPREEDVNSDPGPEPPAKDPKPQVLETFVAKPTLPQNMSFQETALARTAEQVRLGVTFAPILDAGCGIPSAIRATADPRGAGYTVDSCSRVVDAVHALTYQRTITKLGVLDISAVAVNHDGEPLWTAASDCTNLRQNDKACGSDFISRRPTAMSFVGPILSYHFASAVAAEGRPVVHTNEGVTLDVRTGLPAKLSALIDEDSLRDGLKRDLFMRRTVDPKKLDAAKSTDDIWKLWRTQDFAYFGGYYFGDWDAENGRVQLRIWYLEDSSPGAEALKELPLWVTPKAQWKSAFEEAHSETSGFLAVSS